MTDTPISNTVLVQEIISTGKKVSSIDSKLDIFIIEQQSMKKKIDEHDGRLDDLEQRSFGNGRFVAGGLALLTLLSPVAYAAVHRYLGL